MLLGAAIFPETRKYGGGPEKMAIVAARQRWRRCLEERQTAGLSIAAGRKTVAHFLLSSSLGSVTRLFREGEIHTRGILSETVCKLITVWRLALVAAGGG